jgi:hypothetical protein
VLLFDPTKPNLIVPYLESVEVWIKQNPLDREFVVFAFIEGRSVGFEVTVETDEETGVLERVTDEETGVLERVTAKLLDPSLRGEVFFPTAVTFWEPSNEGSLIGNIKDIDFVPTHHHPIEISFFRSGRPSYVEYRTLLPSARTTLEEDYHNEYGPAIVRFNEHGMVTCARWYLFGKPYRCNGPSEIVLDEQVGIYHFKGFAGSQPEGPSEAVFPEFKTPNSASLLMEPAFHGLHTSLVELA